MGIINLTGDSFYEGSRARGLSAALEMASEMAAAGADLLDLGAYSTRPGAGDVPETDEREALLPVISALKKRFPEMVISVDTFRSGVAKACVGEGADMINDVGSGILDTDMFATVASLGVPYVLMHNRGTPARMNKLAQYEDVVHEVIRELSVKVNQLRNLGVKDIIVDPGFGFAKTVEHNFELLSRLEEFHMLGCPLLVGISRKSMIWRTLDTSAPEALNGTTALHMPALDKGASILRVHDVRQARETIILWEKLQQKHPTK